MTGEKRTETRMRCYNTLCIPYISLHPSLQSYTMHACREGWSDIMEYTECYSISFLFLFFFHQSSLYPIKIFAKCFYLLLLLLLLLLFFVRCNSQTTQATELSQKRLQIALPILITFHIKKDTRHELQGTATALAIETVQMILNSAHYK